MRITDELRREAANYPFRDNRDFALFEDIADRIDAEHKKACEDAWNNGYEADYLGIEKWLTEHPQVMEHHDWMRLPKDADGVPIHVGDVMEGTCPSGKHVSGEVLSIGDDKFWLCNVQFSLRPDYMRHYHAPTVEDVLREFVMEFNRDDSELCDEEIIERFAAKLRLTGDAE